MSSPLLTSLLKDVSRSFYLTMRVLPAPIRSQISLAYLLARTSDTIADTEIVPVQKRLEALGKLKGRVIGKNNEPLDFGQLAQNQGTSSEKILLQRVEETWAVFKTFLEADQQRIRDVLAMIMTGQELDLMRFSHATEKRILPLQSEAELDGYTYRVAGCVGEFWTKICQAHLFPNGGVDVQFLMQNGVRFGKGLQMINILRDLPKDLRQGRCYLPKEKLDTIQLAPADLLNAANEGKLRPVYNHYLQLAMGHLAAGWEYTNALPKNQMRVRLACAWPILIGAKTVGKLRVEPVLDPTCRIKVSRAEIRQIMFRSIVALPFPAAWKRLFKTA